MTDIFDFYRLGDFSEKMGSKRRSRNRTDSFQYEVEFNTFRRVFIRKKGINSYGFVLIGLSISLGFNQD